jgi:hypothetical protein
MQKLDHTSSPTLPPSPSSLAHSLFPLSLSLSQVPNGGWFPLAVAVVVVALMGIWWAGSYARRRVMVATAKEVDAANFFRNFTGNSDAPPAVRAARAGPMWGGVCVEKGGERCCAPSS